MLRAAVAAYLGRYRGQTRLHTNSDLRIFLRWADDQGLEPLAAFRSDIERYVRWLREVRRFQTSTVSRRLSIVPSAEVTGGRRSSTAMLEGHEGR